MTQVFNVTIPYLNANDYEANIINWFVENKKWVEKGTILCEVESTKTIVEIQSEESGYIRILKFRDEVVGVGEVIATISQEVNQNASVIPDSDFSLITQDALSLIVEHGLDKSLFQNQGLVNSKVIYNYLGKSAPSSGKNNLDSLKSEIKTQLKICPDSVFLFGDFYLAKMAQEILSKDIAKFYLTNNLEFNSSDMTVIPFDLLEYIIEIGGDNFFGNFLDAQQNQKLKELIHRGVKLINVVHESSRVSSSTTMGAGNFIGAFCYLGPDVEIGDSNVVLPFTSIAHDSKIGTQTFIADGCRIAGNVQIKDHVSLGLSVNINKKIIIGEYAQVVSGKTLIDHVEPRAIIK